MNIHNFQMNQGVFRAVEGKPGAGKGAVSAENDPSASGMNSVQAEPLPDALSKKQASGLETSFPPFFPLGNTQGIFSVMIQARPDNESSDFTKTQEMDNAANREAVAAQQQAAAHKKDESIQNPAPDTGQTAHPGSVLDLKV